MSKTYLIVAAAGFLLTLNALRPVGLTPFVLPGFFASWLTIELAPLLLLLHFAGNAWLIASGAVQGAEGRTALGLSIATTAGLVWIVATALRVRHVADAALREALGDAAVDRLDARIPWTKLAMPFWLRSRAVRRTANVAYGDARRRNRLDVYRARHAAASGPAPILIQVHGGGWLISNKNQQGKPVMMHFAARGWLCIAPNYRLGRRATFPDHLVDVKRAIAWAREHAAEYGGDPGFIAITGGSAGAHLAALAALTANDPAYQPGFESADTSVQACMPMYGVYDFTNDERKPAVRFRLPTLERWVLKKKLAEARAEYEQASPHYRVGEKAPPFFVAHGTADLLTSVDETRRFVARLREVSAQPVVYAELPGAQHAFDVFHSIRTFLIVAALEKFCEWARTRSGEPREAEPMLSDAPSR